jgi:hypothetical protein
MWSRFDQEQNVQIVRHCLVPSVAIVCGSDEEFCSRINRMRWELRWAATPHGKIAVHYLVMDWGRNESKRIEKFLPHTVSNPPSPRNGYCLLQRLAVTNSCFLVLSDGKGKVLRNELFQFPDSLKRTLKDVKLILDKGGPCQPGSSMELATRWYMDHTDFNSIKF